MERHFNIAGLCVPNMHYMVDISGKLSQICPMIAEGLYFTINRARQYGKTTLLNAIRNSIADEYIVLKTSFEGLGDKAFETEADFCPAFLSQVKRALQFSSVAEDEEYINRWSNPAVTSFAELSDHITGLCRGKKLVLLIDEVDAATNFRTFIGFLGMLRKKYLDRNSGDDYTFHSVILAGVNDIKNIKAKMLAAGVHTPAPQESTGYNSPWNIAVPFKVDMSFHPEEIATMLAEYEADHHTGMDIAAISQELYDWTNGYPFLVSRLCYIIDEDLGKNWTKEGVTLAVQAILYEQNTLFDDLFKNIQRYPDLYRDLYNILIKGMKLRFVPDNPTQSRALMFAFLRRDGEFMRVSNKIFELRMFSYFIREDEIREDFEQDALLSGVLKDDIVRDGRFDMELALRKFAQHFKRVYNERNTRFLEENARMVLICYLAPLINGGGFWHIESELSTLQRMDLVIDYGKEEFILEIKLWHGESSHEKAYEQLAAYLDQRGSGTGYLVTFDLRERRETWEKWVTVRDKRIFDVMV